MKIPFIEKWIEQIIIEDGLDRDLGYWKDLPKDLVRLKLKIKSNLIFAGGLFGEALFDYFGASISLSKYDGVSFVKGEDVELENMSFKLAVSLERPLLNIITHASAVASATKSLVDLAKPMGISILNTRKTLPHLRSLESNAVYWGGGDIHRNDQTDIWMIKDNHKKFFGGIKEAWEFFKNRRNFYRPIIMEIHSLEELKEASDLGVQHIMLDNFSIEDIKTAIDLKKDGQTFEVSGGINRENIESYLIKGVDALSVGAITFSPPAVDLSLKYEKA